MPSNGLKLKVVGICDILITSTIQIWLSLGIKCSDRKKNLFFKRVSVTVSDDIKKDLLIQACKWGWLVHKFVE